MKKKTIYTIGIVIVLLVSIVVYCKPLSLSDAANEDNQIIMILNEYGVRNGEPYLDSTEYKDLTMEQNRSVLTVLEKYPYRRTIGTPFSDGSISGLGTQMLSIYVFDMTASIDSIFVTSSGKIAVNGKNYTMKNAEQFIAEIVEIVA